MDLPPKPANGALRLVMYHYVREFSPDVPFLRFLHFDDFRRQLDAFQCCYAFPTREQVERYFQGQVAAIPQDRPNMVLTFDDGLADHYHYVLPELRRRGLWGIFYVPSGPYEDPTTMLDVHEAHLLLGRYDGEKILNRLREVIQPAWISDARVAEFEQITYTPDKQINGASTTQAKRLLNYFLKPEFKRRVLADLMDKFFPDGVAAMSKAWYMSPEQLQCMHEAGMWLGAHSRTHPVLAKLEPQEQADEILTSFTVLEDMLLPAKPPPRTFAYPYGLEGTYGPVAYKVGQPNYMIALTHVLLHRG